MAKAEAEAQKPAETAPIRAVPHRTGRHRRRTEAAKPTEPVHPQQEA